MAYRWLNKKDRRYYFLHEAIALYAINVNFCRLMLLSNMIKPYCLRGGLNRITQKDKEKRNLNILTVMEIRSKRKE